MQENRPNNDPSADEGVRQRRAQPDNHEAFDDQQGGAAPSDEDEEMDPIRSEERFILLGVFWRITYLDSLD